MVDPLAVYHQNAAMLSPTFTNDPPSLSEHKVVADARLVETLSALGYTDICVLHDQVCAVHQFLYTTAVVVGLGDAGYKRRYCFEYQVEARSALASWDGSDHPPGPWIKCKGPGIDLLNPNFA